MMDGISSDRFWVWMRMNFSSLLSMIWGQGTSKHFRGIVQKYVAGFFAGIKPATYFCTIPRSRDRLLPGCSASNGSATCR
jgi:hypothetical protein